MNLAYLDPGSGSMLATAIIAGFAGAAVTIKVYWRRLWSKVRGRPAPAAAAPVQAEAVEPPEDETPDAARSATAVSTTPDQNG